MNIKVLELDGKKGFSFLNGLNRKIIPSQVTKLAKSINTMGIIRPVVVANISFITGKRETYVIDGQHLYHACIRNSIAIPYVEIKIDNMQDLVEKIALLNSSSKSWTLADYILAWQNINKDYIKLNYYFNIYDLELSQIAELLHKGSLSKDTRATISRVIKLGELKITNEEEAVKIMDYITDVLKVIPRMDRISNKTFICCYVSFYKQWQSKYNHSIFIKYLQTNKDKFVLATQDPEEFKKLIEKGIK